MDITPLLPQGRQIINRYGNGGFLINQVYYTGNILILPDRVLPWHCSGLDAATAESFQPLFSGEFIPEIVLIGVGKQFSPLLPELRAYFRSHNVAADVMDTGAACRTYNVLQSEDRRVAAALIAV